MSTETPQDASTSANETDATARDVGRTVAETANAASQLAEADPAAAADALTESAGELVPSEVRDAARGAQAAAQIAEQARGLAGARGGMQGVQSGLGVGRGAAGLTDGIAGLAGNSEVGRIARGVGDAIGAASAIAGAVETISNVLSGLGSDGPEVQYRLTTSEVTGNDDRLNTNKWVVEQVELDEGMNRPFEGWLQIGTEDLDIEAHHLLGAEAHLEILREPLVRHVRSLIAEVHYGGIYEQRLLLRVRIVPGFTLMSQMIGSTIFQDRTVVDILRGTLLAFLPRRRRVNMDALHADRYPQREYCVQYQESMLDFCCRLMEEEGIGFHFDHSGETELLVLTDENASAPKVPTADNQPIRLLRIGGSFSSVESVFEFKRAQRLVPTSILVRDYNWTNTREPVEHREEHDEHPTAREQYDHGRELTIGGFTAGSHGSGRYAQHDARRQAQLRRKLQVYGEKLSFGMGYVTGLQPGMTFELADHPVPELNDQYLVLSVRHFKGAPPGAADNQQAQNQAYYNTFEVAPFSVPYVPERTRAKPRIPGIQTARVCGPPHSPPSMDEPYVDEHGRIKVHFFWDNSLDLTEPNACWIRVGQPMAGLSGEGKNWGHQFIPHPGMEAIVSFVNGDPDRPLVTGTVYNGENHTTYPLPDEKLRSGIRTVRDNELRFVDVRGSEQIYTHARKDYEELVEHDHSTTVKHNQTQHVKGTQTETIDGNQSLTANSNRTKTVGKNETVHVNNDRIEKVGHDETVSIIHDRTFSIGHDFTETVAHDRKREVTGLESIAIKGNRVTEIEASDTFTVRGKKTDHVTKQYAIAADEVFSVTQGQTSITMRAHMIQAQAASHIGLSNAAGKVAMHHDDKAIIVSAENKLVLRCGQASITLKRDGTIELKGAKSIKSEVMVTKSELKPDSYSVESVDLSLKADVGITLKGVLINEN